MSMIVTMTNAPTRTRWLIVALLFGIYMLMVIDRVSISIAAKYMMPEYQLSEVQIGWIFSAFLLGYALFQIPGGWLGDRFGPRRVLAFAVFWWSVFTAVTAVAGDLFLTALLGVVGSFVVVRVLFSLGEGAGVPKGLSINSSYNSAVALPLGHATTWGRSGPERKVCGAGSSVERAQPPVVGSSRSTRPGAWRANAAGEGDWNVAQYAPPGHAGTGARSRSP